ncbi:nitroreductase [Hamadaea sp. NPDC050747]|uniref:Acg family FMN-binding oxidoreductase n=1 Tax=Hamadaea sp. NPDC050747 TaxID=3155789 RepID=UPI0033FF2E51
MLEAEPMSISPQDLLFEAACVACRAPSIANTQPWLWRISDNVLELRCDPSRQLTIADPHGQLMVMSCGVVLHHVTIVLSVLGAAATIERIDDPADPVLLARLTLTGPRSVTAEDMRMHHALRTRRTDRRPFRGISRLPDSVIDLLRAAAAPFQVATHTFDPEQVGLLGHAARSADRIHAKNESYRNEMAAWTTYRDPRARDGVPPTAAVPQVSRPVPVRDFAPGSKPLLEAGPGDDRYTTYLALATHTDTRGDWLRAGEAASAVLLTATTLGIASSVLSEVIEVPGARALLHAVVAPAGFPQLTMRLGLNESGPAIQQTPRRPCSEVITIVGR